MAKGGNAAGEEAEKARREEKHRQRRIRAGTRSIDKVFGQFDKGFYNEQAGAYRDYATPQLQDQFGDASEDLTYWLANKGVLDSSVRSEKEADLGRDYETQRQKIASDAKAYSTDARNRVEDARSNLVATLQATGDAQGASQAALRRASALSQPPSYSPLTQLFGEFTAGLGTQAALERNYQAGGQKPRYGPFIFKPSGSVVNT